MSSGIRSSALHELHLRRAGDVSGWATAGDMRLPRSFPSESKGLAIGDASHLQRTGLKGAQAAAQLAALGLPLPQQPNSWLPLSAAGLGAGLVARLGLTEYFIEDEGTAVSRPASTTAMPGAYPVTRADTAMVLAGPRADELLLQTCNVNFAAVNAARRELALTSMVGVSVMVIPLRFQGAPLYRIWCDPSYGSYLYRTLLGIVEELGGGPIGADHLAPMLIDSIHSSGNP